MRARPRRAVGLTALALCLLHARPGRADEALYGKVAPSTALIYAHDDRSRLGAGTGFLADADRRLVVTARHVVANPTGGLSPEVVVVFAQSKDGQILTDVGHYRRHWRDLALRGRIVFDSVRCDLAVLQLDKLPAGLKPLELAAERVRPGQTVHVVGNSSGDSGGVFGYCRGHVRNRYYWDLLGAHVVATQAPVNKGDSGGPVVNDRGQVVAVACWGARRVPADKDDPLEGQQEQATGIGVCASEVREALEEVRRRLAAGRDKSDRGKPALTAVLSGEVKSAVHLVRLEKEVTYRLRVKAQGFVPDVFVGHFPLNPVGTPRTPGSDWQVLFTAPETKEYRVRVGSLPGTPLGKGPFPYALTVERVSFEPEVASRKASVPLNEHARKLEAKKAYWITVVGRGFEPDVQVLEGTRTVTTALNGGNRPSANAAERVLQAFGLAGTTYETRLTFLADKTAEYRVLVAASPFSPEHPGPHAYTIQVAEAKVILSVADRLAAGGPPHPQGGPFKAHPVPLQGGKTYQIDLNTTAFDSRLLLEDPAGKVVTVGFPVGAFGSRVVFRPAQGGAFRVVATAAQPNAAGPYTLMVTESVEGPAGLPKGEGKQLKK